MSYAYPSVPDLGLRLRTLLATYAKAGGRDACMLLHAEDGRAAIASLARRGSRAAGARHPARGAPRRVGRPRRLARGARARRVAGRRARDGRRGAASIARRSKRQMRYRGHDRAGARLPGRAPPRVRRRGREGARRGAVVVAGRIGGARAATFAFTADKRTTAALAIEHLAQHAPVPQREIALPAGAPFGTIAVNRDTCTMCLACVGACPGGAILDNAGDAAALASSRRSACSAGCAR